MKKELPVKTKSIQYTFLLIFVIGLVLLIYYKPELIIPYAIILYFLLRVWQNKISQKF